jgi:hypothetical protein
LSQKILLITPPLTQLNTPYPATAYLTYFLRRQNHCTQQVDLGIELILTLFNRDGLSDLFTHATSLDLKPGTQRTMALKHQYIQTIDAVISFLQNKDLTLATRICTRLFLPEGDRFNSLKEMDPQLFGSMAVQDKARFYATLYLEDLGDFIQQNIDPGFGFSRYQEKISLAASSFDELDFALDHEPTYLDKIMLQLLDQHLNNFQPDLITLSVPFPGNLYGALRCAQYVREVLPDCAIAMGGGYPNTELRELSDARVFDFVDFICLDDGENPLTQIIRLLDGEITPENLQRTFMLNSEGEVEYLDGCTQADAPHTESGRPDYTGLDLDSYLNIIEVANPMHRLWNDGRWNKMTLAHGCYWKRCSFCDVTLDYIERYDEAPATILVDRIEDIMAQTGMSGFHFVDEAAPPRLMQELALEIIRRGLNISWWTNVRFERAFTPSLCRLLARSGCIAVSGGLEVASDRLLLKMKKGTNLTQVCQSTQAFSEAGILVHAYLMFGFPTETAQETIDSLEVVRQLFENKLIQSGFWHRFALTAHSPIGKDPEAYGVTITGPEFQGFAKNELTHHDPQGCDHDLFSNGLKKSLYNFMHDVGLEQHLDFWFDFQVPKTSHPKQLITDKIATYYGETKYFDSDQLTWLGGEVFVADLSHAKTTLSLHSQNKVFQLNIPSPLAEWLSHLLPQLSPSNPESISFSETRDFYKEFIDDNFEDFIQSQTWQELCHAGLIHLRN